MDYNQGNQIKINIQAHRLRDLEKFFDSVTNLTVLVNIFDGDMNRAILKELQDHSIDAEIINGFGQENEDKRSLKIMFELNVQDSFKEYLFLRTENGAEIMNSCFSESCCSDLQFEYKLNKDHLLIISKSIIDLETKEKIVAAFKIFQEIASDAIIMENNKMNTNAPPEMDKEYVFDTKIKSFIVSTSTGSFGKEIARVVKTFQFPNDFVGRMFERHFKKSFIDNLKNNNGEILEFKDSLRIFAENEFRLRDIERLFESMISEITKNIKEKFVMTNIKALKMIHDKYQRDLMDKYPVEIITNEDQINTMIRMRKVNLKKYPVYYHNMDDNMEVQFLNAGNDFNLQKLKHIMTIFDIDGKPLDILTDIGFNVSREYFDNIRKLRTIISQNNLKEIQQFPRISTYKNPHTDFQVTILTVYHENCELKVNEEIKKYFDLDSIFFSFFVEIFEQADIQNFDDSKNSLAVFFPITNDLFSKLIHVYGQTVDIFLLNDKKMKITLYYYQHQLETLQRGIINLMDKFINRNDAQSLQKVNSQNSGSSFYEISLDGKQRRLSNEVNNVLALSLKKFQNRPDFLCYYMKPSFKDLEAHEIEVYNDMIENLKKNFKVNSLFLTNLESVIETYRILEISKMTIYTRTHQNEPLMDFFTGMFQFNSEEMLEINLNNKTENVIFFGNKQNFLGPESLITSTTIMHRSDSKYCIIGLPEDIHKVETYLYKEIFSSSITEDFFYEKEARKVLQPIILKIEEKYGINIAFGENIISANGSIDNIKQATPDIQKAILLSQRKLTNVEYPFDPSNYGKFELDKLDPRYIEASSRFKETVSNAINKIELIVNPFLYDQYYGTKKMIERRNRNPNEMLLFHGTRSNKPEIYYEEGVDVAFDSRLSSKGLWGVASYFAVKAEYSAFANGGYAHHRSNTESCIFLATVITGDSIELPQNNKLRRPPLKPNSNELYDSVNGITVNSKVYMVYGLGYAYPLYLITYKR